MLCTNSSLRILFFFADHERFLAEKEDVELLKRTRRHEEYIKHGKVITKEVSANIL